MCSTSCCKFWTTAVSRTVRAARWTLRIRSLSSPQTLEASTCWMALRRMAAFPMRRRAPSWGSCGVRSGRNFSTDWTRSSCSARWLRKTSPASSTTWWNPCAGALPTRRWSWRSPPPPRSWSSTRASTPCTAPARWSGFCRAGWRPSSPARSCPGTWPRVPLWWWTPRTANWRLK